MSNLLFQKFEKIVLKRIEENDQDVKDFLQALDPNFYSQSELWLNVLQHHTCFEINTNENISLYAFMLYQADATTLTDTRQAGKDTTTILGKEIGSVPLAEDSVYSFKDQDGILCPTTLHTRIKDKTTFSTLDYCISKYLESHDPYYFTFYYLSLGDVLLSTLQNVLLDHPAQQWIFQQLSVALQVEADLASLKHIPDLDDLHDLMVNKYGSKLRDLNEMYPFQEQYGLHYQYKRKPLHYFMKKFFSY